MMVAFALELTGEWDLLCGLAQQQVMGQIAFDLHYTCFVSYEIVDVFSGLPHEQISYHTQHKLTPQRHGIANDAHNELVGSTVSHTLCISMVVYLCFYAPS